jgi:septal ring factor EnvC (AmiA/AmiB activator)
MEFVLAVVIVLLVIWLYKIDQNLTKNAQADAKLEEAVRLLGGDQESTEDDIEDIKDKLKSLQKQISALEDNKR